jgi:predicted PurR-regulated permease PerM
VVYIYQHGSKPFLLYCYSHLFHIPFPLRIATLVSHNTSTLTPTNSRDESEKSHQQLPMASSKVDREIQNQEVKVNNESENQSPTSLKFALIMVAVLTSLFLVALVCYFFFRYYFPVWKSDSSRTGRLSQQLCRASRTNSTHWTT